MIEPLSVKRMRALAAALGLELSDLEVERLLPEVEALRRAAERLRVLPIENVSLLDDRFAP